MTENNDIQWNDDTLEVNYDGHVEGQAWTTINDEYDVSASVTSYEYQRNGETRINHVPHVVVSSHNGSIVAEPHAHDSEHAGVAIGNAKETAAYVIENPEEFIEE